MPYTCDGGCSVTHVPSVVLEKERRICTMYIVGGHLATYVPSQE